MSRDVVLVVRYNDTYFVPGTNKKPTHAVLSIRDYEALKARIAALEADVAHEEESSHE